MSLTAAQKKDRGNKMQAGRKAKQREREEEKASTEKLIADQEAKILALKSQVSDKNVAHTKEFTKTGLANPGLQGDVDALKKQIADLKNVLFEVGGLPKRVTTKPWSSKNKPFHTDVFKTKKKHAGFELGFIEEKDVENYKADGYNVVDGKDYGENPGVLKRKRMIGVEQTIAAADADRAMLRQFNLAQRTSTLQEVKDISAEISQASGLKATAQFGYEVHK